MTDTPGSTPPFPGFPGFPPAEMLDRMWEMMKLSPFGSALSGAQPAGGLGPSLSMMSDMMAPLTNVEELDKRITDMRAVEQWLKLNLSMLQSAIQALEVQRATLATLRAFGAFAQSSMAQPAASNPAPTANWPHPASAGAAGSAASATAAAPAAAPAPTASAGAASSAGEPAGGEQETPTAPPFDASAWWSLLQSQFDQIARFAMTQPAAAASGVEPSDFATDDSGAPAPGKAAKNARQASAQDAGAAKPADASAAKRPAAKRAPTSAKRAGSANAENAGAESRSAGAKSAKKPV